MLIFTGSGVGGTGVSVFAQEADGTLTAVGEALDTSAPSTLSAPSFLLEHPTLPVLYALNTVEDGTVSALAIGRGGRLDEFSQEPSGGAEPIHAAVTEDGAYLVCAHFGAESPVTVLPIAADGALRAPCHVELHRQAGWPISHHVSIDGDEVVVTFRGLGELRAYRLGADGSLARTWTAPAARPDSGPRHLVRHPAGPWFVSDEEDSTVSVYLPDPGPGPAMRWDHAVPATACAPDPDDPNPPSEIALSADGRFLYVANRAPNTVAVFAVDGPELTFLGEAPVGGDRPRHFALVGSRIYVANERSGQISMLRVDPVSGLPGDPRIVAEVAKPTCVPARGPR